MIQTQRQSRGKVMFQGFLLIFVVLLSQVHSEYISLLTVSNNCAFEITMEVAFTDMSYSYYPLSANSQTTLSPIAYSFNADACPGYWPDGANDQQVTPGDSVQVGIPPNFINVMENQGSDISVCVDINNGPSLNVNTGPYSAEIPDEILDGITITWCC